MTTETKALELQGIGESAYMVIEGMVNALNVDYERLSELRDSRDNGTLSLDELAEFKHLKQVSDGADCREDAEQRIWEDPLSIEVRNDWHTPNACDDTNSGPTDFRILLSTGGPATRIVGKLNQYGEPVRATIQAQDWFTPWTDYEGGDENILLDYCTQFYFNEE